MNNKKLLLIAALLFSLTSFKLASAADISACYGSSSDGDITACGGFVDYGYGESNYVNVNAYVDAKIKADEVYISSYYYGNDNVYQKAELIREELEQYGEIIQLYPMSYCSYAYCNNNINLYFKVTNISETNTVMDILTANGFADIYLNPIVSEERLLDLEYDYADELLEKLEIEKDSQEKSLGKKLDNVMSINISPIYDTANIDGEYMDVRISVDITYYVE